MKKIVLIAILVSAFIAVHVIPSQAQSPEQLYQKGLIKEEGEGALQDAINLYNQVADDSTANISLRAKALLHAGMCYEKMGTHEAVKTYQRLVSSFPEQKNEVAVARQRLSRLVQVAEKTPETPLTPKFTRIEIPTKPGNGVLSPDGKNLVYVSEKSLWILPVHGKTNADIAGEPVRLTEPMGIWDVANMGIVYSSNGKWLAYQSKKTGKENQKMEEIYVVSATGGKPVKVNLDQRRNLLFYDYRMSLSPDGKMLAFVNRDEYKKSAIYTISVDGGTQTKLTDPGTREPAFSPDGKLIAYVKINPENELGNEIWVIPSTGGNPVLVNNNAGVVKSPVWSPDGSMIAFLARKYQKGGNNASNELWIVPFNNKGGLKDLNAIISLDYSTASMLSGWSQDNKIGFWFETPYKNFIYTVQASGGQAMQVTPKNSWMPSWSPDGQDLFFEGTNTDDWAGIETIPVDGGDVTKIPVISGYTIQPGMPTGGISVSPDGSKIVFAGYYYNISDSVTQKKLEGSHIMTIPVIGGTPFQLTANPPMGDGYPTWSPDGKTIAFVRVETVSEINPSATSFNIYTIPADGGTPKKITSPSDRVGKGRINWSPDGKWIGFFSDDKAIKVISPEGENSRIVINDVEPDILDGLSFSPDGYKIAFSNKNNLFTVDLSGENKAEVKTGLDEIHNMPAWSPDGKKIAFTAYAGGDNELWLMENFLPLEKLVQKAGIPATRISEDITVRQIWSGQETDDFGSASADGSLLSFTEWESGNLAVRNMKTGENRLVTNDATWLDSIQYAEYSLISHDGKQFAYTWYYKNLNYQLRLIKSDGKKPLVLYSCKGWDEYITPRVWFADGGKIIAQRSDSKKKITQLISVNTSSGEIDVLKETAAGYPSLANLALSPGETYLAYDFPDPSNNGMFDIHVISLGTKQETAVVEHPANDRLLGWLPGRNEMLFVSDRSGTKDLWALNVADGKPSGVPRRILKNTGDIDPKGFTKQGSLLFGLSTTSFESFIVPLDSENGKVSINERTPVSGQRTGCTWLPDGESLIFNEYIPEPADRTRKNLVILNTGTGKSRILAENLYVTEQFCISPDGRSAVALGLDQQRLNEKDYNKAIYLIDIETGSMTEVKTGHDVTKAWSCEWDKDGKNIFYFSNSDLVKHNLQTGDEKVIYSAHKIYYTTMIRSHEGDNLLFHVPADMNNDKFHLLSVPVNGGDADTLATYQAFGSPRFSRMALSPDGRYIYLTSRAPGLKSILSRIPSTGGTPENLWQSTYYFLTGISVHPGGKKIALSTFETAREIRIIDNLDKKVTEIFDEKEQKE